MKLAAYYQQEQDERVRVQLLKALANKDCAYALNIDTLIRDSRFLNEELQEYAFQALGYLKNEKVYEYALTLLSEGVRKSDAVSMLAKNYHKQDQELFVRSVKSLPVTYDDGRWHSVFSDVIDMFMDKSIKNPPKELLSYMYEHTLCSCCREVIVKEMGRRRMLSGELLQECVYDSNCEIREYAQKKLALPLYEKEVLPDY